MSRSQCVGGLVAVVFCAALASEARAGGEWKGSAAYDGMRERIATLAQVSGLTASARQERVGRLNEVAEEIDRVWRDGEDREGYSRLALQVISAMASIGGGDLRGQYLAQRWAIRALERADAMPLEVQCAIVSFVQHDRDAEGRALSEGALAQVRRVRASLWLQAWQRIDRSIDEEWSPADTGAANVVPPGGGPAGMDPAAISDPVLRAQYEADIAANRQKIIRATEQFRARDLRKYWVPTAKRVLIRLYMEAPNGTEELRALLEEYISDASDREQVLDAVVNMEMPAELVNGSTTQPAQ